MGSTSDYKTLTRCYEKAKFIFSISDHVSKSIQLTFPQCQNKIVRMNLSFDHNNFKTKKKENIITYMSRKLPHHSKNVLLHLKKDLPQKWKIKEINNLSQKHVYELLSKSKIFLSFSELEGLGMPPLEAAMANNKVIGYTGEGGKEFWKKPIFTEIKNGEIINFRNTILREINKKINFKMFQKQKTKLIKKYSTENDKIMLMKAIEKIRSLKVYKNL